MSEREAFLEKVHIRNFLSLQNVELPLKPLTVLVGPNASGKTNILDALRVVKEVLIADKVPPITFIKACLWAGTGNWTAFQLNTKIGETLTLYELELKAEDRHPSVNEAILIDGAKAFSHQSGRRVVWDEDRENKRVEISKKIPLVARYKNKPVIGSLMEFINSWEFYDFQPRAIRDYLSGLSGHSIFNPSEAFSESPKLDEQGLGLSSLLSDWYKNDRKRFDGVSEALAACTNIRMDYRAIGGNNQLCLLEGYKDPISLGGASDGTLRLIGYYTLLNQPEVPPLIAIEEPERNLHPGVLKEIVYVLGQLAERTQVIITTHSSQLLDSFSSKNLSDWLGVLLLRNRPGLGTEVLNLEDIRTKREALDGWMADFGIGSAIFDSRLLQDLMEEPVC